MPNIQSHGNCKKNETSHLMAVKKNLLSILGWEPAATIDLQCL